MGWGQYDKQAKTDETGIDSPADTSDDPIDTAEDVVDMDQDGHLDLVIGNQSSGLTAMVDSQIHWGSETGLHVRSWTL